MLKTITSFCLISISLMSVSCSLNPVITSSPHESWSEVPTWAQQRMQQDWWKQYGDSQLNSDVATAFANNPDLAVIAARLNKAEAQVGKTKAASLPSLNLGFGYREGREQEVRGEPYNLTPWKSSGQLSWEVDLSGKLRAATSAAKSGRNAAFWDLHAAKLQLASSVAATRFNLYRFNTELDIIKESLASSKEITSALKSQMDAGIIASTAYHRQEAEHEKFNRQRIEVQRLRDVTKVQLSYLIGNSAVAGANRQSLPTPKNVASLPIDQLIQSHPTLLAAETRLRAAFQLEKAAKLNLLPSFKLNASAMGAQKSLSESYKVWQHQFGPSLDIPIYDPTRLAQVKVRRAAATEAAANYRASALKVLEEIDTASINLRSRKSQLASARREIAALATTRQHAAAQYKAGLTSQIEFLDTERSWLAAKQSEATLKQSILSAHIQLIKALGGG